MFRSKSEEDIKVENLSGGKDSCYNMMQCVCEGHDLVALANLHPKDKDELDSYMYQTVGHHAIDFYAEAMGLPLYRRVIEGTSKSIGRDYEPAPDDEVEDLYQLLKSIKDEVDIEGVSVGAILSDYQRVRVENVCYRLCLTCLAYLWRRDQDKLLQEMMACHISAVLIKVAGLGLDPEKHLGKSLSEIYPHMVKMNKLYGLNICGEGGEYETFTLDCPLFNKTIVIDETEMVIHSDDAFAPVGYLNLRKLHLEDKPVDKNMAYRDRIKDLPMKRSSNLLVELDLSEDHFADIMVHADEDMVTSLQKDVREKINVTMRRRSDGHFWISGVHSLLDHGQDILQAAQQAMDQLQGVLHDHDTDLSDLVAVYLYVKSIKDFGAINSVYKQKFRTNPPCRVCVQAKLPPNLAVQLDCYGWRRFRSEPDVQTQTMHVQGLSHWAPANIGPYSQAVQIQDRMYVAGQIALCPASMSLVRGGIYAQCRLSLRHVSRVLSAMSSNCSLENVVLAVCYVTHKQFIKAAEEEWKLALSSSERGSEEGRISPMVTYVVVPVLPRTALVEWQVYASKTMSHDKCKEYSHSRGQCAISVQYHLDSPTVAMSCLGTVRMVDQVCPSASELIEYIFQSYIICLQREDCHLEDLPLIRMFYCTTHFSHGDLYTEIQNYFESRYPNTSAVPVSIVPVQELSHPDCVLTFCH